MLQIRIRDLMPFSSWIRDRKIRSAINIMDQQHCFLQTQMSFSGSSLQKQILIGEAKITRDPELKYCAHERGSQCSLIKSQSFNQILNLLCGQKTQGNVNSKSEFGKRQLIRNENIKMQVHCRYLILTSVPYS